MTKPGPLFALVFGRGRPSVHGLLGGILGKLMSLQQTIETMAADVKLNATVTAQTAALAASTAVAVKAIGETVTALAKATPEGIDTSAADASLAGVGDALKTLLATTQQTGATLPGTDAAPAGEAPSPAAA